MFRNIFSHTDTYTDVLIVIMDCMLIEKYTYATAVIKIMDHIEHFKYKIIVDKLMKFFILIILNALSLSLCFICALKRLIIRY